jgi:putative ABC transport system permease protein
MTTPTIRRPIEIKGTSMFTHRSNGAVFGVAVKGLLAHKVRLATTMLSIILGVALMAGTLVLTDTVGTTFDDLYADINRGTDAIVRAPGAVADHGGGQRGPVPEALLATVRSADGVQAAGGTVEGYAQFVGKNGKAVGDPGHGAPTLGMNWPAAGVPNPFNLVTGHEPRTAGEVVMDKASADKGGFAVGDPVTVLTRDAPRQLTVAGITRFGTVDSPLGASIALFDTATAQALVGRPGELTAITVVGRPGHTQEELAASLRRTLPAGVDTVTGAAATAEQQSSMRDNLSFFSTFLLAFAGIALFVGAFIIANTFSIIVAQRSGELALLRALGASRAQVRRSVLIEAALVGLAASVIGVGAGIVMASGLKALLGAVGLDVPAAGTVLTPRTVAVSVVLGLAVTLVSAVLPARKAAAVAPVAAMRAVAADGGTPPRRRIAAGFALGATGAAALVLGLSRGLGLPVVAAGAALVLLAVAALGPSMAGPLASVLGAPVARLRGTAGRLARANATRNPRRTSATAAALMVGLAMVASVTILAASAKASIARTVDEAFRSDLVVDGGGMGAGLSPALGAALAHQPEIAAATPVRTTMAAIAGGPQMVVAVDPAAAGRVADIDVEQGNLADLRDDGIALSRDAATAAHIGLGDTVSAGFPGGQRDLRVAAVFAPTPLIGGYVIGTGLHGQVVPQVLDHQVYVSLRPGVAAAEGRAAVERVAAAYPNAQIQDLTELKAAQTGPIDQMLTLVYALLLLAVVIALLGIANTLALSVHERTRELGLLRAVGMSRAQLRATVRWESVIIALFGTALGLAVGLFFGWAAVTALAGQGVSDLTVPVGQLAAVTVLAAGAGVVAALLPARRAARLDVLQAIATA